MEEEALQGYPLHLAVVAVAMDLGLGLQRLGAGYPTY